MHQGWFQVAGLLMDFAGVMLLAYEWVVGHIAQRREDEIAARGVRDMKNLDFAQQAVRNEQMAAHYRMVAARTQERIRNEGNEVRQQGHRVRLPVFATAMVLIAGGFLLQVLGSWPGGIATLGVVPN
jgi:hypothetical protein